MEKRGKIQERLRNMEAVLRSDSRGIVQGDGAPPRASFLNTLKPIFPAARSLSDGPQGGSAFARCFINDVPCSRDIRKGLGIQNESLAPPLLCGHSTRVNVFAATQTKRAPQMP